MERRNKKSSEGKILTNGEIFAYEIDLGNWDSPDNWKEVPISVYEESLKQYIDEVV